ncbi:hypothetical protein Efla_001132 [Eimeria flavescens]
MGEARGVLKREARDALGARDETRAQSALTGVGLTGYRARYPVGTLLPDTRFVMKVWRPETCHVGRWRTGRKWGATQNEFGGYLELFALEQKLRGIGLEDVSRSLVDRCGQMAPFSGPLCERGMPKRIGDVFGSVEFSSNLVSDNKVPTGYRTMYPVSPTPVSAIRARDSSRAPSALRASRSRTPLASRRLTFQSLAETVPSIQGIGNSLLFS